MHCGKTQKFLQLCKKKAKNGERQFLQCPGLISKYNESMSVDQNDQLRQYYSIRACGQKCNLYIAYFSIDVAITNAYIFHCLFCELSFHNMKYFHLNLATKLISLYNSQKRTVHPSILPELFLARVTSHKNRMTTLPMSLLLHL